MIKTISEQIAELSGGMLKVQSEVSDPNFKMFDDGAITLEDGELVFGFIKRTKPHNVLSTGIYTGISDLFIGMGLKENGFGHLDAIEYEQVHIDRATKLWERMGLLEQITAIKSDSLQFQPKKQYQFMFLDTELFLRLHELVKFFPYLDEGGYVFIHDVHRHLYKGNINLDHPEIVNYPMGKFPPEFEQLLKTDKLRLFCFPGARGLVGFYKPAQGDYKP